MAKYDDNDGVWRTIGGRRVFIKKGQSMSEAMKESGKFKSSKKEKENTGETENKVKPFSKEDYEERDRRLQKRVDEGLISKEDAEYEKAKQAWQRDEITREEFDKIREDLYSKNDNTKENDLDKVKRIQNELSKKDNLTDEEKKWKEQLKNTQKDLESGKSREEIIEKLNKEASSTSEKEEKFEVGDLKRKALERLPKEDIDTHEGDLYIKKTKESEALINNMKNKDNGMLSTFKDQQTGETWYDIPFANMEDDYKQKTQKENDYLPKKTEIKEQGKSNRKEVSENIQAHILEYYDSPDDFIEQMDAMDYLPTKWKAGEEIAKGGSYLIYNQDMSDFLDELKINPKGKKFNEDKSFQMYTSLIGRESEKLYDRLTKARDNNYKKAFQQYKKENPNTNMDLNDFIEMMRKKK